MYTADEDGILIPSLPFPKNCFKKEEGGHTFTQRLILEFGYFDEAIYTIKDEDFIYKGKLYPSLKGLYMTMGDYVEYDFANTHFLNYGLWNRLCKNNLFKAHIKSWREELELKMRSEALRSIIDISRTPKGFAAAKFLMDRGFAPNKRGRPSKEDVERETKAQAALHEDFSNDFKIVSSMK